MVCSVKNLHKHFGKNHVLDGVSMTIEPGECVGLMGPSGSGKSTLLNCISGIDRPDLGEIQLGNTQLSKATPEELARLRRETVSTVFHFFHLLPTLNAFENIELSLQLSAVGMAERKERVAELLDAVGLTSHTDAYPETLSGGERQRVAIARALAHRPALMLADEPTGSLDTRTGEAVLDLLGALAERFNIAMLLVTHSADATRICSRTLQIRDGRID